MTQIDAPIVAPAVQANTRVVRRGSRGLATYRCLVLAGSLERLSLLAQAAGEGGWKTVVAKDCASALSLLAQSPCQLALVDLEAPGADFARKTLDCLLEMLVVNKRLLVIVCGNTEQAEEEIWIRQQGVWLYLPGVASSSDVAALCAEARLIAERLAEKPKQVTRAVPGAKPAKG